MIVLSLVSSKVSGALCLARIRLKEFVTQQLERFLTMSLFML